MFVLSEKQLQSKGVCPVEKMILSKSQKRANGNLKLAMGSGLKSETRF